MGVWLFMVWSPRITRIKARAYLAAVLLMGFIFGVIFVIRSLETQGYRKRGCDYENYPGHTIDTLVVVKDRGLAGFSTSDGRKYVLTE
jgi:hypothetical protein